MICSHSAWKKLLVFSSLHYKPTGEKVVVGFRYYACAAAEVVAVRDAGNQQALTALPYALDEDGDPDTSGTCLLIAYTKSVSILALQPQEYQDYVPVQLRPPLLFEGESAAALKGLVATLDQTY